MSENLIAVHVVRNKKWTHLNLTCIEDKSLSWKAKAIHTYMISRPPGWQIKATDLINRSTDGQVSMYSGIQELIDANYVYRMTRRNDKRQIVQHGYVTLEEPSQEKPDLPEGWSYRTEKDQQAEDLHQGNLNIGDHPPIIYNRDNKEQLSSKEESNAKNSNSRIRKSSVQNNSSDHTKQAVQNNSSVQDEAHYAPFGREAACGSTSIDKSRTVSRERTRTNSCSSAPRVMPALNESTPATNINTPAGRSKPSPAFPTSSASAEPGIPEEDNLYAAIITMWNDLGLRQHKNPVSKTYRTSVKRLKDFSAGRFMNGLTPQAYQKYKGKKFKRLEFRKAFEAFKADYERKTLQGKEFFRKLSLSDFLFYDRTNESFFIRYLENDIKPAVNDPDPELTDILIDEFYKRQPNFDKVDANRTVFVRAATKLNEFYDAKEPRLVSYNRPSKEQKAKWLIKLTFESANGQVVMPHFLLNKFLFSEKLPAYLINQNVIKEKIVREEVRYERSRKVH